MKSTIFIGTLIGLVGCSATPELTIEFEDIPVAPMESDHDPDYGIHTFQGEWVDTLYVDRGQYEHAVVVKSDLGDANGSSVGSDQAYEKILEKQVGLASIDKQGSSTQKDQHTEGSLGSTTQGFSNINTSDAKMAGTHGHSNNKCPVSGAMTACHTETSIFFELDSSELSDTSKLRLDFLVSKISGPVEVVGYADSVGEILRNKELALQRANSVKDYLSQKSVKEITVSAGLTSAYEGEVFRRAFLVGIK